jgi:hypothetical protein
MKAVKEGVSKGHLLFLLSSFKPPQAPICRNSGLTGYLVDIGRRSGDSC